MTEPRHGVLLSDNALMTLTAYPPEDQSRIRSSLGHLIGPGALERLWRRVHELPGDHLRYSFRVPGDILVIFKRQRDMIVVTDIVRRGTLEVFAAARSASANSVRKPEVDAEPAERPLPPPDARPQKSRVKPRGEARRGQH
jgi:hypothetical protein